MSALTRPESRVRLSVAVALPAVAAAFSELVFPLIEGPKLEQSPGMWVVLWAAIPVALVLAGALVSRTSSILWIAAVVTVSRRAFGAMSGHHELDFADAGYFTLLALEFCAWLAVAAIGRFLAVVFVPREV